MNKTKALLLRVPEITLIFWVIKILSTTVGETGADYMAVDLGMGMPVVTLIMSGIMTLLLLLQFTQLKKYVPSSYWGIVVLISVIGTLITDILVDDFSVGLLPLSIVFTIMMLGGFWAWYKKEGTLSIHTIDTSSREAYYWIVILLAFALGTAVGDLISEYFALGYDVALSLFAGMIALVTIAYYFLKLNAVLAFWIAYILTRPLGASLGDFLIQSPQDSGLGVDMLIINASFFFTIVVLVFYLTIQLKKSK